MYQVSVPVILKNLYRSDRADLLKRLHDLDCRRVMLSIGVYEFDKEKRDKMLAVLKEETAFFHQEGFEVGTWLWTFMTPRNRMFDHMVLTDGYEDPNMNCPLDERFRAFAGEYLKDLAAAGVDVILFDDDFRFGWLGEKSIGCFCPRHREAMQKILKKPLPEDLEALVLGGGPNEYRSAWLKAKGDSLRLFAGDMRKAVDTVRPEVRIGLCACMSVWDHDGVTAAELSRILAGNTKPLLRLIGAPYWAAGRHFGGTRLQNVIEYERLERSWCGEGIEVIAEGDTYPRPRYACPANMLESFDMALRADGRLNGILKYAIDYCSSSAYEPVYAEKHVRHRDAYRDIERVFGEKECVGVRIYEPIHQFEQSEIPEAHSGKEAQSLFFRTSAKLFSSLTIPTTYGGPGSAVASFGETVRTLPDELMDHGVILDAKGAKLLTERGIDVGLISYGETFSPAEEYYLGQDEYALIPGGTARMLKVSDNAVIDSIYYGSGEQESYMRPEIDQTSAHIAAYRYENAAGQRFFVLGFDAEFANEKLWRQYAKGREIANAVEWLSGKKLPAYLYGAPDAYMLAKQDKTHLAVGLWNLSVDDISSPVIELSESYGQAAFHHCSGKLEGSLLHLDRIEPYGFALIELTK